MSVFKYLSGDVIRHIVSFDMSSANSLSRTCKTFNKQIMENFTTVRELGKYYSDMWEEKVQKQFLRLFTPNKRNLYRNANVNNGMGVGGLPLFADTFPIKLESIKLSWERYGKGNKCIDLDWNINNVICGETCSMDKYKAFKLNSAQSHALELIIAYGNKYCFSKAKQLSIHDINLQTSFKDIICNMESIDQYSVSPEVSQHPQSSSQLSQFIENPLESVDPVGSIDRSYELSHSIPFEDTAYETWGEHKSKYSFLSLSFGMYVCVLVISWIIAHYKLSTDLNKVVYISLGLMCGLISPFMVQWFIERFTSIKFRL